MKRAIFLNLYFSPDHSATSQILTDLAFHVAASGMETHVVTSQQLYDDPDARLSSQETVRDVHTRFHFFCPGRIGSPARLGLFPTGLLRALLGFRLFRP